MQFEVTGHARQAKPGQDIVCAGVSVLTNTLANTVAALQRADLVKEGYCYPHDLPQFIFVRYGKDKTAKAVMETFKLAYEQMADQYPQHIKLNHE